MIGRVRELAQLRSLVDVVVSGGRALVIEGDAGAGKSALLSKGADLAVAVGFRRLDTTGIERGSAAGLTCLHELLHPLLNRIDALPDRQRSALLTAFGLADDVAPDRLDLCLAALSLLEDAAAERPLVVLVEDVQWLDPSSADVIGFVARRLTDAPILLLATRRPGTVEVDPPFRSEIPTLHLGPLSGEESEELLDRRGPRLSGLLRERVLEEANGNPLALLELSAALLDRDLATAAHLPAMLPLTGRLEEAFTAQVSVLPKASRRLLVLIAAGDDVGWTELTAAASLLDLVPEDLEPAQRAALVNLDNGTVRFRHPLIRSAVYQSAPLLERNRAHLAHAAASEDPDRRAWHHAEATQGVDEDVAKQLDHVAQRALNRGAPAAAAAALRRAAALSAGTGEEDRRLAAGAWAAWQAGLVTEAAGLVDQGLAQATDPSTLAQLAFTRAAMGLQASGDSSCIGDLLALARRIGQHQEKPDEQNATAQLRLLTCAAFSVVLTVRPDDDEVRRQIRQSISALHPTRENAGWLISMAVLEPVERAADLRPLLAPALRLLLPAPSNAVLGLGFAAEALQDLAMAASCWDLGVSKARQSGSTVDLASALMLRGRFRIVAGRLDEALVDIEHARRLAMDLGYQMLPAYAAASSARVHAWRGDVAAVARAVGQSKEFPGWAKHTMVLADNAWATGVAALGQRLYRDAWVALRAVAVHPVIALWAVGDLTEAAVRAGKADTVAAAVEDAERAAAAFDSTHLRTLVHRCRALLGEGQDAEDHLAASVEAGQTCDAVLELARTQLLYGEWLRRQRRIAPAQLHLSDARQAFRAAGAQPWAERAEEELAATGVRSPKLPRDATGRQGIPLTPQEYQIARMAATGMTNREIADHLHLSHRTVSAHLHRVFPKLGISARRQLSEWDASQEDGAP